MSKKLQSSGIVMPPQYVDDRSAGDLSKAEQTRAKIFKSSWLPALTGEPASTYEHLNTGHLRELYPLVWMFGPKAELIQRQLTALQLQFDRMLALKGRQQQKLVNEFVRFELELDEFMFEHGNDLGSKADNRVIHTFHYGHKVTEDQPLVGMFYPSHFLKIGNLPYIDHGFNDAVVMFISMTVNMKRVSRTPIFEKPLDLYVNFCKKWDLPSQ